MAINDSQPHEANESNINKCLVWLLFQGLDSERSAIRGFELVTRPEARGRIDTLRSAAMFRC
jgi:hypothetical protein